MEGHVVDVSDVQSLSEIQSYLASFNKDLTPAQMQGFILTTADHNVVNLPSTDQLYAASDPSGLGDQSKLKLDAGQLADSLVNTNPSALVSQGSVFSLQSKPDNPVASLSSVVDTSVDGPSLISLQSTVSPQIVHVLNDQLQPHVTVSATSMGSDNVMSSISPVEPGGSLFPLQKEEPSEEEEKGEENEEEEEEKEEEQEKVQPEEDKKDPQQQFRTVTIVPSEVNQSGEVSYVLIVSNGEEGKAVAQVEGDMDLSVYDFKEEKDPNEMGDLDKKAIVKYLPKRAGPSVQTALMCNYCNYTSPKRYLLTRHMKTHSEERPHKCFICNRGFKTMPSLQNHINTHTGVRPHKCKECNASFTTSGELVRHNRYKHTFEKPHRCPNCDYASVELSKLKRHLRSHTGERPYQCPHCTYASPDTYKLKRHLRIHTGEKPYKCDICNTRFTQSNSLKAHKLIHTGNKPIYQCELCPTTCGRRTDLKIHVQKLHTSDKPIQCKKCGKHFPDRYTYKIHVKTHEGEKCYKCELCPYSALSQRHLESHILTHTGEKPFRCEECDQTFRQKQLLKRHLNLYHTPDYVPPNPREKVHECPECHKIFAHYGNLVRHLVSHDPDNIDMKTLEEQLLKEGEEEEGMEEGEMIATQGQLVGTGPDGIQLAEVNGQQVQVQLVSVGGEDGQQVYIQIGPADGQVVMATNDEVAHLEESTHQLLEGDGTFPLIKQEEGEVKKGGARRQLAQELDAVAVVENLQQSMASATELSTSGADVQLTTLANTEVPGVSGKEKKREKQKDIETCFGFDLVTDDPQ